LSRGKGEEGRGAHLVKVHDDRANVRSADGDHTEEAVPPAAEKGDALVEDKEILETLGNIGGDGVEFTCNTQ
jgi:hypothetical protein